MDNHYWRGTDTDLEAPSGQFDSTTLPPAPTEPTLKMALLNICGLNSKLNSPHIGELFMKMTLCVSQKQGCTTLINQT